mgnify:CR=1 FL=1
MLHHKKISQRRVLLFDHIGDDGFRTMPSTDSDHPLISGRHAIGTSGRHPSERVDGMLRNRWSAWAGLCSLFVREAIGCVRLSWGRTQTSEVLVFACIHSG